MFPSEKRHIISYGKIIFYLHSLESKYFKFVDFNLTIFNHISNTICYGIMRILRLTSKNYLNKKMQELTTTQGFNVVHFMVYQVTSTNKTREIFLLSSRCYTKPDISCTHMTSHNIHSMCICANYVIILGYN